MFTRAVVAIWLCAAISAHAQAQGLKPDDRFCLRDQQEREFRGCRAVKFRNEFYYRATCPDMDSADAPDHEFLITDQWTVVMEGEGSCTPLIALWRDVVFSSGWRGGGESQSVVPPPVSDSENVVRVLFGTNRKIAQKNARIEFTGGRDSRLHLGGVAVSIPAKHDIGSVERPWSFRIPFTRLTIGFSEDRNKHFNIRWLGELTPSLFVQELRDAVDAPDIKQAFVFIHGYNVSFDDAAFRTAQLAHDMRFRGAPIFFSWPSRGELENYRYDLDSARFAKKYLVDFLELIKSQSRAEIIHLVAHSMGNDPLMQTLMELKDRHTGGEPLFNEVILAAPDIDLNGFLQLVNGIRGVANGITLYANNSDRAIEASRRYAGNIQRAGGLPPVIVDGVDTIDVTEIGSSLLSLNHSDYADNPILMDDIRTLFQQSLRPPDERSILLRKKSHDNAVYWKFVRN